MDYSTYRHLDVSRDGSVVTIAFNRPEQRNALNGGVHEELGRVFGDVDADDRCDVVILTGRGRYFCGGGDIDWVVAMCGDPIRTAEGLRIDRRIQTSLLSLEKPIIAKVRGSAIGLACSIALYCDFVYATPDTVFVDPHVSVGQVAGDGGAVTWPQLIGYARARRHLLTGEPIRGAEAASIGLITDAVPDEELDGVVAAMTQRLVGGATRATGWTKAAINGGLSVFANAVLDRAEAMEALTFMTEDCREALEAIHAKERPAFRGR